MKAKTKERLMGEIESLRHEVAELERKSTECKGSKEALKESEERYRQLAESITDIFFAFDDKLKYTYWNKASETLTGILAEDALGKHLYDIFPDTEATRRAEELYQKALITKQPQHLINEYTLGDKGFVFEISAYPTDNGLSVFVKDITEHKRVEDTLKESEERYRSLFENSIEAVFACDLSGRITEGNRALEELCGYSLEELVKMQPLELIPPESREYVSAAVQKMLKTGEPVHSMVYESLIKDGQRVFLEESLSLLKRDGKIVGFQGTVKDITERKLMEEALRESEERYMRLYHGINEAVALYTLPDLKISHWNKRYEDLHNTILTKDIKDITISDIAMAVESEDWDMVMERMAKILACESVPDVGVLELRMKDLEGKRRVWEIRPSFYKENGQIIGVQVAMADITGRKYVEEALRASEEKWRSLAENAPNIIIIVSRDGTIEFINRTMPLITTKEAEGKSIYHYTEPRYHNLMKETIGHVFQTGKGGSYEVQWVGADGGISWYETQVGPIKHDGEIAAVTLITSDITKLKKAQAELQDSLIDMAETVSRALESRDPYTAGHQRRVAELARIVGERMGLDVDTLQGLYIGGLLHDIGKISIPASILSKMGNLAEEEWALVCSHPKQGYNILKETRLPWPVADMALHHHERLDGSGYPHGLKGDKMSLEVRILVVCDVVEAMGSYRPYRPARSKQEVIEEIQGGKGTKYDADVVDIMVQIVEDGEFEFAWNSRDSKSRATKVPAR